ncbi:C2H2 zinc finger transcription factor [Apiospora rasikravindrae]|uniref:C2H2 zinc finger transcription factor n=1 Tax=Apiospora rasikravindrae TaxID=990691 RepID=A0ABR1SIH3_9PEZI
MSLSSSPEPNSTVPTDSLHAAMQPFTPGQCLFCPTSSPSFSGSVAHMQTSHGLFVPYQGSLIVDLETLFKYLHLVISEYRECIHCGTTRATVQAVQQHMTGKGHCRLDVSQDSEFAEFYDFSDSEEEEEEEDAEEEHQEESSATASSSHLKPTLANEDSIRLPSGRIISRQSSPGQTGYSFTQHFRRRTRKPLTSQLEYSRADSEETEKGEGSDSETDHDTSNTKALSKREKRERAAVTYQLASMSASDRNTLIHLPASEQRSLLATQLRHQDKVQKEEKRRRTKVDRKGNKNLYAYWHTETPVYTCG